MANISNSNQQDIEDLDHYEMKEEEPVDGKKSEDDGIEKENLAILEKIRKNQRQDHLNVSLCSVKCCKVEFMVGSILDLWLHSLVHVVEVNCKWGTKKVR